MRGRAQVVFYCQILKNVISDSQGNSAWAFPLQVQFVVCERNRWLGDGWLFAAGRGGEQHFPGRVWLAIACTKGAREVNCVLCWWGWAKQRYDKVGKGYLESTLVEGLGRSQQVLEQRVRLNPPLAALEGVFFPSVLHNGMSARCCRSLVQLQSSCAALEGSRCLCEMEITALLIYKALLRYQDD